MIFDTIQMDLGEKAFKRMLRVHYDPAIGAMRPWVEHEDVYADLTNKNWRQVISQLARYQVKPSADSPHAISRIRTLSQRQHR